MRLPEARSPSMRMCFSSRCQPRGRTTIVASSPSGLSAYALPSSEVKSIIRSSASLRLSWPSIMFVPQRGVGVLEVGQPDVGAGVERVDRHLPVGRAGDLDPPVDQAGRGRRDPPGRVLADVRRLRQEVEHRAAAELAPAGGGARQSSSWRRAAERVVQRHEQFKGLRGQDLRVPVPVGPVISTRSGILSSSQLWSCSIFRHPPGPAQVRASASARAQACGRPQAGFRAVPASIVHAYAAGPTAKSPVPRPGARFLRRPAETLTVQSRRPMHQR